MTSSDVKELYCYHNLSERLNIYALSSRKSVGCMKNGALTKRIWVAYNILEDLSYKILCSLNNIYIFPW